MFRILAFLCLFPLALAASAAQTVLVFGDSLSAGFGIRADRSWPALLGKRLAAERPGWTVANASISGETTAGGRGRLPEALDRVRPSVLVLALGANDGLRGLPVARMRENLAAMIRTAHERRVRVLLVGMKLPPNYGPEYTAEFEAAFRAVTKKEKVPLLPFLLQPIALDPAAYQPDRLHPTAEAQPKILDHVWPVLKPLLR